jgi:SAM-dependent methyltransferase
MRTSAYTIRGGVEGRERLRLLSAVMGPSTRALLFDVGVPSGSICLDIGCGGGDVTFELTRATGPTGRAIGVDLDETKVEMARREAEQQGLSNAAFEVRDVTKWKPAEPFDVVYARFLLSHLTDPGSVVAAMRPHIRSDGVLVVEDIDFRGHFAEPHCPALSRYVELYTTSVRNRGGDPNIGPRLPGLLRDAGCNDVKMRVVHHVALEGGIKLLSCVTLENIAEAVLEDGLTTEEELSATINEFYAFARDPHTVLGGPRIFQVWGRNVGG